MQSFKNFLMEKNFRSREVTKLLHQSFLFTATPYSPISSMEWDVCVRTMKIYMVNFQNLSISIRGYSQYRCWQ